MPRTDAPRHFAMFTVPAHGHVRPSLAIVRELAARGHRVSYATTAPFADLVAAAGARPVLHETTWPTDPEAAATQWDGDMVETWSWFLDEAIHVTPQLEEAFAGDRPELALYDIGGYQGRLLAHRWGIPAVQLSPAFVGWDGYEDDMAGFLAQAKALPGYPAYAHRFAAWLAQDGVALSIDAFTGVPERCLALLPRALQPHADRVDERRVTFVGPCVDRGDGTASWTPPAGAGRVLLVSLGSAFTDRPAFFRACLEAFGGLEGWHVVLAIGRRVDPAALGSVPANVELHAFAPQVAVLEHADAFVTHAGMGGAKEGLAPGVPMVAVPQAADQFANADRLAELGVARRLDAEQATPAALREAVLAVAEDPVLAARLAALRDEIRQEGGAVRAADLLEGMLAG